MRNNFSYLSVFLSVLLHIAVGLIVLGFNFRHSLPPTEEVFIVDMVPLGNISNVPNRQAYNPDPKIADEAKKILKTKKEIIKVIEESPPKQEKEVTKLEKKEIPKLDSNPVKDNVQKTQEKLPLDIKKTKTLPEKKIKKNEKKPNNISKKVKKIINDSELDSLLKNLEEASEGDSSTSKKTKTLAGDKDVEHTSKGSYDENNALSITEIAFIRQQIEKNWNRPIGVAFLEEIQVTIHIQLALDGNIKSADIINVSCGVADAEVCKIVADSSIRAVWQSSPIQGLSQERYSLWQEFNFLFTPKI